MKSYRIPVLLTVLLISFGLLTLFITAVSGTSAAPAEQEGIEVESERPDGQTPSLAGGPDDFGYAFVDSSEPGGPLYSFVEITNTGTAFPLPDSAITGPLTLGFDFDYYGATYTEVSAVSNGYLWFDNGTSHVVDSTPDCPLPNTISNENYIAVLHDDLDGQQNTPNGNGYFESFAPGFCPYGGYGGACFVTTWDGTYHDATTDNLTFQAILFDDDSILMQYKDAGDEAGSGSTTGLENSDASIGLTYACDTASSITDNLAVRYEVLSGPFYGNSSKTGPTSVLKGDPITYTLFISNSGPTSGTNTVITDAIPAGTTYIPSSVSCGGGNGACSYVAGQDAINWTGEIEAGEMVTVEFAVDSTAAACGSPITNLATITDPDSFGSPLNIQAQTTAWDNVFLMEDFETTDGGFVANTPPGEWAWGDLVPATNSPPAANSGTKLWATNLSGDITAEPSDHYLTRTLALPLMSQGQLVWWDWWHEDGSDEGTVTLAGNQVYFIDANQLSWEQHSADLSPYGGQTVDLVYYYLAGGALDGGAGWFVDDVSIVTCDPLAIPDFSNSYKTAPETAVSGDTYTYTVAINNTGGVDATGTIMTDTIPSGTTYVPGSATNGAIYNSVDNQIEWTGTVTSGESVGVSFMVTATLAGQITNTAVITHPDVASPTLVTASTTVVTSASYPVCEGFELGTLPDYGFAETTSDGGANGRVAVTNAFPNSGTYALDLDTDCAGCGGNTLQSATMVVDLAGETNVGLNFWVFEHGDENHPEDGVFISDDGGLTWAQIVNLNDFPASYQNVVLDLEAAASGAGMSLVDGFLIRFQSFDNFPIPSDGYSFDDICVEPLQPEIAVDPTTLASTQPTNQVFTESLLLSNNGSAPLNWTIAEADTDCGSPAPLPWANAQPAGGTTAAGSNNIIDVGFDSTGLAPAVYEGLLCFNSDDPVTPTLAVSLTLTVEAAPIIDVNPNSLASTQEVDTQVVETLTISNTGSAPLNWDIVEQDSTANFESTAGSDATQADSPAAAGNIELDTADEAPLGEGVELPPASGYTPEFMPAGYVLYDNGPLVNGPGTGAGGADESILQTTSLSMNTLGFGNAAAAEDRTADDFTIPAGDTWELDQITFFAYQTGSPLASTIFSASLRIWDGEPGNGGTVIWGDTSTNVLIDSTWSVVYRATETTTGTATDRPIMANTVDLGGLVLPAGTYWLDWQSDGSLASGPFAPPISINGVLTTGNGLVTGDNGATWAPALDSGSDTQQGFPFIIEGTPGCGVVDIPWASTSPSSGTTPASGSTDVDVTFDSTGLSVGVYNGTLCVNSDDPITPLVEVPLNLTVTAAGNMPPVAVGDDYTMLQDTVLNVTAPGVLGNDFDPDSDPLTAVLDTTTTNGSLTLNADGSFTYTPDGGFSGTDGFTYHANDGTADSNTVTVVITVEPDEYIIYMPYIAKPDATASASVNWLLISLSTLPMMTGMLILYRRKDRFDV